MHLQSTYTRQVQWLLLWPKSWSQRNGKQCEAIEAEATKTDEAIGAETTAAGTGSSSASTDQDGHNLDVTIEALDKEKESVTQELTWEKRELKEDCLMMRF